MVIVHQSSRSRLQLCVNVIQQFAVPPLNNGTTSTVAAVAELNDKTEKPRARVPASHLIRYIELPFTTACPKGQVTDDKRDADTCYIWRYDLTPCIVLGCSDRYNLEFAAVKLFFCCTENRGTGNCWAANNL